MNPSTLMALPADAVATIYRLDGKVDEILARMDRDDEDSEDFEDRLSKVERRQYAVGGASALVGFLTTLGISILGILPK